jgi:hypothetical protein
MGKKRTKLLGVTWFLQTVLLLAATTGWSYEAFRVPEVNSGVGGLWTGAAPQGDQIKSKPRTGLEDEIIGTGSPLISGRAEDESRVARKICADLSLLADNRWSSRDDGRDLDRIIRNAYEDILRRDPGYEDLRYYRDRMINDGWTENDVREDLRRSGDYQRGRMSHQEAERIVRDAYQDVLRREPDPAARAYVDKILYDGWTEADLKRELRKSDEYRRGSRMSRQEAERIVREAYREVLRRDPDSGSRGWVDKVFYDHWTKQDVVNALKNSDEYRHGSRMSRQEAERMVREAYREVLRREPDKGSRGWVDKVLYDHWTKRDVVNALRNSDEYKHKGDIKREEAERMVREAYREVLGREPDPGSRGWVDKVMNEHWSMEDVARALRDSDEYRSKHR